MNETLKKINIVQLALLGSSVLLNFLSVIIPSLFVSWTVFVGLGLAIFVFMSNITNAFKKDMIAIIFTGVSAASFILAVFGFFNFINVVEAFIGTMI